MGELVHAAVVLRSQRGGQPAPAGADLIAWCRNLLANYKVCTIYISVRKSNRRADQEFGRLSGEPVKMEC